MDWTPLYPQFLTRNPDAQVRFVDIGCGYGGLLGGCCTTAASRSPPRALMSSLALHASVELATMIPDTLMLGMEIRIKVADYVHDRTLALRA